MRIHWLVPIAGLFAALTFAQAADQTVERTLQFARTTSTQDFQEATTMIRMLADIRDVTVDSVQRTVALRAPADQAAIADWLFSQLDNPSGGLPAATPEYHIIGSRDNIVRLYHVANASTVQDFQGISTLLRTICDMRFVFTYNSPRIIGLRGPAGQMAMAEWLFQELDQPLTTTRVAHEFFVPDSSNDVLRVFYFPLSMTVQSFQETATEIRKATEIKRAFTNNAPRSLAVRGTIEQLSQAASMVQAKGGK